MTLKMKYGAIKGDSSQATAEGLIDLTSMRVSSSRSVRSNSQSMREIGLPTISEIQITTPVCSASPLLIQQVLTGKGESCEFQMYRTSPNGLECVCVYKVTDALLTSHSFGANANEGMEETFTISFTAIDISFKKIDAQGKVTNNTAIQFDFKKMK